MATNDLDTTGQDGLDLGTEPAETTLREDIDAAFTQHATDEVDEGQPRQGEPRPRDEQGRFARQGQEPTAEQDPAKAPGRRQEALAPAAGAQVPIPAAPRPGDLKAPASWTPSAREKWGTVDPELRAEIVRRESEAQRVLQESAGLRQFPQAFHDTVRPYEMFIRAEGSDPLRAVQGLMNTAAELRVGTAQQKANIVANIVRAHGIDLQLLDDTLAQALGVTQPGGQPTAQQQLRDPRVDQLIAQNQQWEMAQRQQAQQREAWESQAIAQGLEDFASTHEFYADVRDTMADLVDLANKRGEPVNLEKIYARACQMDDQVSTILAQRGGPQSQQRGLPGPSQAVLRARRAAVSVKGNPNPEGSTVPKNDSVRAAIEAAFDSHGSM
jgi:hypothetical protein